MLIPHNLVRSLRAIAAAFFMALALVRPAAAVDFTDLWWNSGESGWGVNFIQADDFIFATFFIYGTALEPTWYSGQLTEGSNGVWSGPLYLTAGSYFGAPWNPGQRATSQVGTVTFTPATAVGGTLTYNVGGIVVTKAITRQTLQTIVIGGGYFGGIYTDLYNCNNPLNNQSYRLYSEFTVAQTAGGQDADRPCCAGWRHVLDAWHVRTGRPVVSHARCPVYLYQRPFHDGERDANQGHRSRHRGAMDCRREPWLHRSRLLVRGAQVRRREGDSPSPHGLEEHHRRRRTGVEGFHAAGHWNRDPGIDVFEQRRRNTGSLIADDDRQGPVQWCLENVAAGGRYSAHNLAPSGPELFRPRAQVYFLDDGREEMRALPGAQYLGRPSERASPSIAALAPRLPPQRCAGSYLRCPDPAGRRAAGEIPLATAVSGQACE